MTLSQKKEISMKKITKLLLCCCIFLITTACSEEKNTGLNVKTTIYPISFITEQLYTNGNTSSIYPDGAETENYNLTEKQIKEHSRSELFIYNGLNEREQNIAKSFINNNRKLQIIDVAYGLKNENGLEELWLSPNYFLMLTTTIKNNLINSINNKYTIEEIEKKYKELAETLSLMDADLRSVAKSANEKGKGTIIASSNMFKYLNNYGFNVVSLEDSNANTIKNNFLNKTYTTIFMKNTEVKTDLITSLEKDYGAKIIVVNTMTTLTAEEKNNNETYLTIMNNYIENIKNATLG